MLDKKLILIGYSGHGYVISDIALENKFNIIGYLDIHEAILNPFELDYLGSENENENVWELNNKYIIGIGDNYIRDKFYNLIKTKSKSVQKIISQSANISNCSTIGEGVFINRNVVINALSEIQENVILNTGCIIEHNCIIGKSSHIAPGAVLAGNVTIGDFSFIGANSIIKQGVKIGNNVTIGAGSVIIKDVPNNSVIVGNPGKYINNG